MKRKATAKQRAAARRNLKKARAARRTKSKPRTRKTRVRKTRARKARKTVAAKPKRRVRRRRSAKKMTSNRRRRIRRNPTAAKRRRKTTTKKSKRSAAAKKAWRTRRRKAAASGTPVRRRRRKGRKMSKARRSAAAKKAARTRKSRAAFRKKAGLTANRRRRRKVRKNPRGRRRLRRNARMSYVSNRRRSRRKIRRNGRRRMRRNTGLPGAFKAGLAIVGGFAVHKLVTALIRDFAFKPALEAAAPEAATTPTSGLGQLSAYSGVLVGLGTAVLGILAAKYLIKKPETRQLVVGGIAASWVQTALVTLLDKLGQPGAATMLAGVEDGTAAKISAMYGFGALGAGTSIMPEYRAIRGVRGMGEYFRGGRDVSGLGEYFASGVNGLGEYFASGVSGLGALKPYEAAAGMGYTSNPDLYQAAAGMGSSEHQGNHIDPSSDLDRELTIAEAAAGVGNLYQAAAGLGHAQVNTVPSANTWIPGMSNAPIWAGVKSVDNSQSTNEMLTAGILQTDGGQGVFG